MNPRRDRTPQSLSRARSVSRANSEGSSVVHRHGNTETSVIADEPVEMTTELTADIRRPKGPEFEASSGTLVVDLNDAVSQTAPNSGRSLGDDHNEIFGGEEEEERLELEERALRPFYRRPSPWWMLGILPFVAVATFGTIAPRIEIYTKLACDAIKPEYQTLGVIDVGTRGVVPSPSKLCSEDPDVQAAVAQLMTFMSVSMGILACITTGWWGQLSDRYGRLPIIRIAACGLLITDLNFILVTRAAKRLPGGYRFLFVGPVIDGFLGGMTTVMAGLHAYMSDSTPPEGRSRVFSLNLGLLFGGMAFGPTLGSLIIRSTGDLLSVFYLSTGSHIFYTTLAMFVIPESLTRVAMRRARKRREALQKEKETALEQFVGQPRAVVIKARMWSILKKPVAFLAPLAIFLPFRRPEGKGWDCNLTFIVLSSAFEWLLGGSYGFTFQYAQKTFGWDSEVMGYWLSVVGSVRAIHLIVFLPFIIKFFHPKASPIQLPTSPSEPLHPHPARSTSPGESRPIVKALDQKHSPLFDLALTRVSICVELIGYIGMAFAMSSVPWTAASVFRSFGGGFAPGAQSVALALYERGPYQGIETGRLFGGLSVVQALSSQILGPSLFGLTYALTVNEFPKAIFILAAGLIACAVVFTSIVQIPEAPPKTGYDREEVTLESE